MYLGVSHVRPVIAKPQNQNKQSGSLNNSAKHMTTKESFPWNLKIVHTFKLPFQFHFLVKNLWVSGRLVNM